MMKILKSFTNKYGHTFDLSYEKADVSDLDNECWGFNFIVNHIEWGSITMRAGIRKSFIKDEASADKFIEDEPLEKVKNHLEAVDKQAMYPLFEDSPEKGWFVV